MGDLRTDKLQVLEYEQGIILPRQMCEGEIIWGLGGVCDASNQFVTASFYDGGWAKHGGYYEWEEEQYIDKEVVYIGIFSAHWGHFLIDMTNRLWCLREFVETKDNFLVAYLGEETPQDNNLEFFKILRIQEKQLIHITEPTRFKKVYVPEQAFKSCEWYTKEHIEIFDYICEQALQDESLFEKYRDIKKIYFTRRNFLKAKELEFGEEYFQKHFLTNGYEAIAPECLTLQEQIYIWNHAEKIICVNGTIPLNVLFCKNKDLKLTILNKTSIVHENPYILLRMRKIEAEFVNIYKEPFKKYPKSLGTGPFLFWNTNEYKRFTEKQGMNISETKWRTRCYFVIQEIRYCWSIIGITRKIREVCSKLLSKRMKEIIRRVRRS